MREIISIIIFASKTIAGAREMILRRRKSRARRRKRKGAVNMDNQDGQDVEKGDLIQRLQRWNFSGGEHPGWLVPRDPGLIDCNPYRIALPGTKVTVWRSLL